MLSRIPIVSFVFGVGSCVFLLLGLASRGQEKTQAVVGVQGWEGKLDGVKSWQLPDTPNGLRPIQSWFGVGSSPNGDIYVAGSDHRTNSALYRLDVKTDILRYVGDAKSASRKVNNWLDGETAEKFHTRPTSYNGRMYVASTDYSKPNDNYVAKRGFHWYAYDITASTFLDLSVSEPKGVGAEHAQIMAIAVDSQRGYLVLLQATVVEGGVLVTKTA